MGPCTRWSILPTAFSVRSVVSKSYRLSWSYVTLLPFSETDQFPHDWPCLACLSAWSKSASGTLHDSAYEIMERTCRSSLAAPCCLLSVRASASSWRNSMEQLLLVTCAWLCPPRAPSDGKRRHAACPHTVSCLARWHILWIRQEVCIG